jgi:hypothetical protein
MAIQQIPAIRADFGRLPAHRHHGSGRSISNEQDQNTITDERINHIVIQALILPAYGRCLKEAEALS